MKADDKFYLKLENGKLRQYVFDRMVIKDNMEHAVIKWKPNNKVGWIFDVVVYSVLLDDIVDVA